MFSIVIPSFNNVNYLKICLKSIEKNSKFNHEVIVNVNDGSDGTLEYIKSKKINLFILKLILVCVALLMKPLDYQHKNISFIHMMICISVLNGTKYYQRR